MYYIRARCLTKFCRKSVLIIMVITCAFYTSSIFMSQDEIYHNHSDAELHTFINNRDNSDSQRSTSCHDRYAAQEVCNIRIVTPACGKSLHDISDYYKRIRGVTLPLIKVLPTSKNSTIGELKLNGKTSLRWNHPGKSYIIYGEINITTCSLHLHRTIFPSLASSKVNKIRKYQNVAPDGMWMVWMAEAPIFRAVRIFKKLNIPFVDLLKIKIGGFAAISWKTNQGATECTFSGSEVVSRVEKTVHKGNPFSIGHSPGSITHEYIASIHPDVRLGGSWSPPDCTAPRHLVIILPYRNRDDHLLIFLNYIFTFLKEQKASFSVFVVEQAEPELFNKAALMNVGFLESRKVREHVNDCYIFHDVDLLPEDLSNMYTCDTQPRHLMVARNTTKYKESLGRYWKYQYFGGVVAMTADQIKRINGFPNTIFGWGGEDDEIAHRIRLKGMNISEYPPEISMYSELPHDIDRGNPHMNNTLEFYQLHAEFMMHSDGLNTTDYTITSDTQEKLYTHLRVRLKGPVTELELIEHYRLMKPDLYKKKAHQYQAL